MSSTARSPIVVAFKTLLIFAAMALGSAQSSHEVPTQFNEFTVAQLQEAMSHGRITSEGLTEYYIDRILALDQNGPGVNSVIELNPDAIELAERADAMRRRGATTARYPLLGIPLLLKDNIDTGDRMQTTAGSFALAGLPAVQDSTVAAKLRAAGAVILGKTNLSEWANFRSTHSTSGWSGRGGLTHNPYSLDRNACGSSSGSGAAASANFAAISFGSETDGSIVCPGSVNGVVDSGRRGHRSERDRKPDV
jgi:amidase